MKKNNILLTLIIVFSAICIVFTTTLIISSIKVDYAQEHYDVTSVKRGGDSAIDYLIPYGYGCGEIDCKYCNGRKYEKDGYSNFVYYKTYNSLKIASIVLLSINAILVVSCFYLFVANRKLQ